MDLKEFYEAVGGDDQAMLRRLPAPDMIRRFLRKFEYDPSYRELCAALDEGNLLKAYYAAYTLKGVAANLGLDALAGSVSTLAKQLRYATQRPSQADVEAVERAYQQAIRCIQSLSDEG